ncbi:UpxY family transcription antiterminator [Labilibaculum antarcticum]|uniref:NusG-like N-terminal domain-containing protein n=1 Tax=Labilibaculum antarcticum TaxID=1717717 RepID=A0A1Y1CQC7_9BACT|nr:UpxY family transcription antiterminator [Labilibaculum antarcticum]BAX82646.1 hypothetical protein ALGA_4356 [Labilibaculum antarcticum]
MNLKKAPSSWYAIYTKSRSEKKLYDELIEKGLEGYMPVRKELRVWSDRKKWVETPLFTSYVFVRVNKFEYFEVLKSDLAVRYVSFEGKAVPIPANQIEAIRFFLSDSNRDVEMTSENLKKGDLLEVIKGPLKGVQGEVIQMRGKSRIVLRFPSLGCCVHTEISLAEVEPIKKKEVEK